MKKLLFLLLIINSVFANTALEKIEVSFEKASKQYEVQKKEHNITKLLDISKTLYENNQKLKELKNQLVPKLTLLIEPKEKVENLQIGDILHVKAKTLHKTSEDYEQSKLSFYIYDEKTLLASKDFELYEKGGLHEKELKFQITKPSQNYKVCARFIEDMQHEKCERLVVKELVETKEIIVSTKLEATKSDESMLANRDFYLFVPFKNKSNKELQGKIVLQDSDTKEVIVSQDFVKPSIDEYKKAGLLVPKKFIKPAQNLYATISLWADGVNKIEKELYFRIDDFDVKLNFPSSIKANEHKKFSIIPAKEFVKPLHVNLNPRGAISIGSKDNLSGTISAISKQKQTAYIDVYIKDASGLEWRKKVKISVGANEEQKYAYKGTEQKQTIQTKKPIKKNIPFGTTKMMNCSISNTYSGKCNYKYNGKVWIREGAFRLNHSYSTKESDLYSENYKTKGRLGIKGVYKNGKYEGKLTQYHGNGQVSNIRYYKNGKRVPNNFISYFSNGKIWRQSFLVGGNIVNLRYTREGRLYEYNEKIGNAYINLRGHGNDLYISDVNGKRACKISFKQNRVNKVTCYYPSDKNYRVAGEKSIWGSNSVSAAFKSQSGRECKNRVDSYGKVQECKANEEANYVKRFDAMAVTLSRTKGSKYFSHFNFEPLKILAGEGLYHIVYNSILKKKLFIYSNPTKDCQFIGKSVESSFVNYFNKLQNKFYFYEKARVMKSYGPIKDMIMKDFAKKYYSKYKKKSNFGSDKCYNSVVRFYKQLGYNNAY